MRKITKEDYFQEIESIKKECEVLGKKRIEIIHNSEFSKKVKENNNDEYLDVCRELRSKNEVIDKLNSLYEHLNYKSFYSAYHYVEDYFKTVYQEDEVELPDELNEKADFLFRNYIINKDNLFNVECCLHPYAYDDPHYFDKRIDIDINRIKEYFKSNRRSYVYTWELEYLNILTYYDKLHKENNIDELFDRSDKSKSKEHLELEKNFRYLLNELKNKKLNLSLYLWTIYKMHQYFRKLDSDFVIDEIEFTLIGYLFDFAFMFFNNIKFVVEETKLSQDELGFIRHLCALLAHDLICTIENCFPDYYSTNIMYLGYGCYIPAGCSDLTTSLNSFENFIEGICDYDFWYDSDISGEEVLLKKIRIKKNYESLMKGIKVDAVI